MFDWITEILCERKYSIKFYIMFVYIGAKKKKNTWKNRKNIYKKEKNQEQNNCMYCTVQQSMTHTKNINIEKKIW